MEKPNLIKCSFHGKLRLEGALEKIEGTDDYRCKPNGECTGLYLCEEHQKMRKAVFLNKFKSLDDGHIIFKCKEGERCSGFAIGSDSESESEPMEKTQGDRRKEKAIEKRKSYRERKRKESEGGSQGQTEESPQKKRKIEPPVQAQTHTKKKHSTLKKKGPPKGLKGASGKAPRKQVKKQMLKKGGKRA